LYAGYAKDFRKHYIIANFCILRIRGYCNVDRNSIYFQTQFYLDSGLKGSPAPRVSAPITKYGRYSVPGPYIHIAVSDRVRDRLKDLNGWTANPSMGTLPVLDGPSPQDIAALARAHPSYFALGAIGPDLFFFLPDFRTLCIFETPQHIANSLIGIVHCLDRLYEALDKLILEDWERYFGPGSANTADALSRLTGDLSTVVSDIIGKLFSILTTALLDLASQAYDWFGLFSLGLNMGYDNQDFFWSDMLHYRKTSQFGRSLWELAAKAPTDSDKLRAYALGYITHLAADTTGHPFVNEKSGGPFRTHWQRHHLVENHMDAQTYDDDYVAGRTANWPHDPNLPTPGPGTYSMLTESALHYRILFKEDGTEDTRPRPDYQPGDDSLHGLYVRRRHLDIDSTMPDALAKLLFAAMGQTYNTSTAPTLPGAANSSPRIIRGGDGRPATETIKNTYLLLFEYLKLSMLDGFRHKKPNPPEVFPNLAFPQLTDPHDDPPNEGDTDMSFWDRCLAVLRFILWLRAVALWLATILPAIILDVATILPRLAAYYTIELPLYYMLQAERRIMVMTSFLHPMRDEIEVGLVRMCLGPNDFFLSMLKDMNDVLGGIEDVDLATIVSQVEKLGADAAVGLAQLLGLHHVTVTEPNPDERYPHAQPLDNNKDPVEYHAPWQYPSSPMELGHTFAGPYTCGDMPRVLLDATIPGTQAMRAQYENATVPSDTDQISLGATATDNLGDPVNFSAYLIWQLTRTVPPNDNTTRVTDWNLDSDRGYAYKCWDWDRQQQAGASLDHVLLDTEGHQYMEPCTAPPQSENPDAPHPCYPPPKTAHDPTKPLKIHYTGQANPGCVDPPVLTVSLKYRASGTGNLLLGVSNTGGSAAINVNVPSVTGITAVGATFVEVPTNMPPFSVAGGANLQPAGTADFNLFFEATSGSAGVPFSFVITMQADNVPSFSTTISVP
jgi:hypothetical protein